jgi:ABC-type lipoprotein release transport system permease subunit
MILLLALRNIVRNKKTSAIIIMLIGVITFLFFFGNTIIGQSGRKLKKSFVDNFTGDIVIEKKGDVTMSLFGANIPVIDNYFSIETLPAYNEIIKIVEENNSVDVYTSTISTTAVSRIPGGSGGVFLSGIDTANYFKLFPGITLLEGDYIKPDEYGVMITEMRAQKIEDERKEKLVIGEALRFISGGDLGFEICDVPLRGIFSYDNVTDILNEIILMDAQNARTLAAIQVASSDVETPENVASLLAYDSIEDMFEALDNGDVQSTASGGGDMPLLADAAELIEADTVEAAGGGEWNFILLRLKSGADVNKTIAELNAALIPHGAIAVDWRTAAGISAILVLLVQALYNAAIVIMCIAGVITIINILLIAVFRRTREIGTLRALGAKDAYIRSLLLSENSILGFAGGILGIALGAASFAIVNSLQLHIGNELISGLLGGNILKIDFYPAMAFLSCVFSLLLSFIAEIIPVEMAVKIEPVIAVREG